MFIHEVEVSLVKSAKHELPHHLGNVPLLAHSAQISGGRITLRIYRIMKILLN